MHLKVLHSQKMEVCCSMSNFFKVTKRSFYTKIVWCYQGDYLNPILNCDQSKLTCCLNFDKLHIEPLFFNKNKLLKAVKLFFFN